MAEASLPGFACDPAEQDAELRARHRRDWYGYLAISLGAFIAILDIQIVASSINQIQAGLSASADEIQWVQSAYLIAETIAIPLSGYLSRLLSTRVYLTLSALGFTLASLLCAMSWNLESMVIFRIIQGFLGGGMIPTSFAAMFQMFPEAGRRQLPQLVGGLLTILAPSMGPTFGGYITGIASWHWLFLVNLGPGLICAWGVWTYVHYDRAHPEIFKLTDWPGLLFMAAFLGGLTYTLDEGPRSGWLADHTVLLSAVLMSAGSLLFFWRVLTTDHPIVDLRPFRNRNFAVCALVSIATGMSVFTLNYLTPLFLGRVRGYDSLQIGEVLMVQGCAMFLSAPIIAKLSRVLDPRWVIAIGIGLISCGSFFNGHMTADWGFEQFMLPQMLRGIGLIFAFIPMTQLALGTLPPEEVKNASGLYSLMRNIGGALGLALVASLLNDRFWLHWQSLASHLSTDRPAVRDFLASPLFAADGGSQFSIALLTHRTQQQALTMAYSDMYLMIAGAVALTLLLMPLIAKPKSIVAGDMGH